MDYSRPGTVMKRLSRSLSAIVAGLIIVSALHADRAYAQAADETTQQIFLVRHAKKDGIYGNVPLDEEGVKQAQLLAGKLANKSITSIYATNACRTIQTVMPLAESTGQKIVVYQGKNYGNFSRCEEDWESGLLDKQFERNPPGDLTRIKLQEKLKDGDSKSVLVADHSEAICGWLDAFEPDDPGACRSFACPWDDRHRYGDVFILSKSAPGESWSLDCKSMNFRLPPD